LYNARKKVAEISQRNRCRPTLEKGSKQALLAPTKAKEGKKESKHHNRHRVERTNGRFLMALCVCHNLALFLKMKCDWKTRFCLCVSRCVL
jgi:hypothetical protein